MPAWAAICLVLAVALITAWHAGFVRYNRRRASAVLRWIESALAGNGKVVGVRWSAPSCFRAQLRVAAGPFQRAWVVVQLAPRQSPLAWFMCRLRRRPETLTFEADLEAVPGFDLDMQNHRWWGRTRRRLSANDPGWLVERCPPLMITTRRDWQHDLASLMDALLASREGDFLGFSFRRTSPHFSASLPLESIVPHQGESVHFFQLLSELAGGASPARF